MDKIALFQTLQVAVLLLAFIFLYIWATYNSFVKKTNQVKADFSDIIVELKRRTSLIDQLISIVKGYATHEKTTFEDVTKARSLLNNPGSIRKTAQAENMITDTLKSLFAVVESYPELKAQENYISLMRSLEDAENRIAHHRIEYNESVKSLNDKVGMFPSLIVAAIFGFKTEEFFEVENQKDVQK